MERHSGMSKRVLTTLTVIALVIFGVVVLLVSSIGESTPAHTMQNGATMKGGSMGGMDQGSMEEMHPSE
jgi:hypothetical protein